MLVYKDQFVYLDDQAVLSNSWAGKLFKALQPDATQFEAERLYFPGFKRKEIRLVKILR